jgi:hypothetical protein
LQYSLNIAFTRENFSTQLAQFAEFWQPFLIHSPMASEINRDEFLGMSFSHHMEILHKTKNSGINTLHDHASDHASVQVEKLVSALIGEMGRSELQELLSIKNRDYFSSIPLLLFYAVVGIPFF